MAVKKDDSEGEDKTKEREEEKDVIMRYVYMIQCLHGS
jgi:hypothetical protein